MSCLTHTDTHFLVIFIKSLRYWGLAIGKCVQDVKSYLTGRSWTDFGLIMYWSHSSVLGTKSVCWKKTNYCLCFTLPIHTHTFLFLFFSLHPLFVLFSSPVHDITASPQTYDVLFPCMVYPCLFPETRQSGYSSSGTLYLPQTHQLKFITDKIISIAANWTVYRLSFSFLSSTFNPWSPSTTTIFDAMSLSQCQKTHCLLRHHTIHHLTETRQW